MQNKNRIAFYLLGTNGNTCNMLCKEVKDKNRAYQLACEVRTIGTYSFITSISLLLLGEDILSAYHSKPAIVGLKILVLIIPK